MSLKIIRVLWLIGNVVAVIAWHLPPSPGVGVMGVAVLFLMVAYLWAIGRALVLDQGWWCAAITFFPIVMWGYAFGLGDLGRSPHRPQSAPVAQPETPARPARPLLMQRRAVAEEPLALRQAREVLAEAELQDPEW